MRKSELKPKASRQKAWILCEAFTRTGSYTMVHDTLGVRAAVCEDRKTCLKLLKEYITDVVSGFYEGDEQAEELTKYDVSQVLSKPYRFNGVVHYMFSTDDREARWKICQEAIEAAIAEAKGNNNNNNNDDKMEETKCSE